MSVFKRILDIIHRTPQKLGREGEEQIARKLKRINFHGYHGKILRNLYVPKGNGETTEIDLLYLTPKGVFVIESKNYSGYIFGNEQNANWTSALYAGKGWFGQQKYKNHSFYNPIWQNKTHIRYLKNLIPDNVPLFSIIVFSSHCELKQIELFSSDVIICQQSDLRHCIKKIWDAHCNALTHSQVENLYRKLYPLTKADSSTKSKHVHNVRSRRNSPLTCPYCGGSLVVRIAKNGKNAGQSFYGCSNYPRCKYTRDI